MKLFILLIASIPSFAFTDYIENKNEAFKKYMKTKGCVAGIYTSGISFDSFNYIVSRDDGKKANIPSTLGLGLKFGSIILCPRKKFEIYPYVRLRYFQFEGLQSKDRLKSVDEQIILPSTGYDFRYFYSNRFEFLQETEIRREYAISLDDNKYYALDSTYLNTKLSAGVRYFIFSNKTEDYTFALKRGILIPSLNESDISPAIGNVIEYEVEYFKRINKSYSLRADIYYSTYEQDLDSVEIERFELGTRFNYVVRY